LNSNRACERPAMPATLTTLDTFECPERDWSMHLGMMDWDNTRIVMTKRQLIDFLKYTGTTVDTNWSSCSKLPRYATFCKLDGELESASGGSSKAQSAAPEEFGLVGGFKPTRRVRDAPGGKSSILFSDDVEEETPAPSRKAAFKEEAEEGAESAPTKGQSQLAVEDVVSNPTTAFKPTRRVREAPGGTGSLGKAFWGDEAETAQETFKPSRRVRENPGGTGHGPLF